MRYHNWTGLKMNIKAPSVQRNVLKTFTKPGLLVKTTKVKRKSGFLEAKYKETSCSHTSLLITSHNIRHFHFTRQFSIIPWGFFGLSPFMNNSDDDRIGNKYFSDISSSLFQSKYVFELFSVKRDLKGLEVVINHHECVEPWNDSVNMSFILNMFSPIAAAAQTKSWEKPFMTLWIRKWVSPLGLWWQWEWFMRKSKRFIVTGFDQSTFFFLLNLIRHKLLLEEPLPGVLSLSGACFMKPV